MKYSLLALGLLGFLLADSALAAQLPAGRLSTAPDPRHGNYDNDDGVSFALVWPSNKASASGHDVAPVDLHDGAHDHMHGAGSSSPFDPSSLYGPNGEVLEPIPGINAPPIHSHRHGAMQPLQTLNETAILASHDPNPLSYWTHDYVFESDDKRLGRGGQYGGWIVFGHGLVMVLACLLILPLALAFRTVQSPFYGPMLFLVCILSLGSLIASWIYRSRTPNLYAHETHSPIGYVTLGFIYSLGVWDADCLPALQRSGMTEGPVVRAWAALRRLWSVQAATWRRTAKYTAVDEEQNVASEDIDAERGTGTFRIADEEDEDEAQALSSPSAYPSQATDWRPTLLVSDCSHEVAVQKAKPDPASSTSTLHHHHHRTLSEPTEHPIASPKRSESRFLYARRQAETFVSRIAVVLSFTCTLSGITIYAGACRAQYLNGCLAHLIKGAVFFWYGILTWARYLGAWQEYGWAWNVRPHRRSASAYEKHHSASKWTVPTAEMVESATIFGYGLTNTWLERLGAESGAPLTIHEVQHIGIACMFFFGGLLGILLELTSAKRMLSTAALRLDGRPLPDVPRPPSWAGSFNPFPALVIGVTGLAMSAHHQAYVFAIEVHALWGNLLALSAIFRIATYVFLWLRPPRSILPSRPPTEALAAFSLCAGGVVFILSNEQVVFGAMRSGWDSIMAFLTGTVSLVSIVFGYVFVVLVAKGWATDRQLGGLHQRLPQAIADSGPVEGHHGLKSPDEETLPD